jgi:hypothetical protein
MECTKKIIIIKLTNHYNSHLLKVATIINVGDTKFGYNTDLDTFYPIEGKNLGTYIPVKHYTVSEFITLLNTIKCESLTIECTPKIFKDIIEAGTFESLQAVRDNVTVVTIVDYPAVITYLEWLGLVKIKKSKSQMSSDGRMFTLVEDKFYKCSSLVSSESSEFSEHNDATMAPINSMSKFVGTWYEVDFLGTTFGSELTEIVTSIYNKYFGKFKTIPVYLKI